MRIARAILLLGAGWMLIQSPVTSQSGPLEGAAGLIQRALLSYRSGDYELSEQLFKQFLTGYGKSAEAQEYMETVRRVLSLSLLQQQKFDDALPYIEQYLKNHPKGEAYIELSYWRGAIYYIQQDYEPAYEELTQFFEKYPNYEKAEQIQLMRGMCQLALGKLEQVLEVLLTGREDRSESYQGRVLPIIVYCQLELQKWDDLIAEIRKFDPYAEGMSSLSKMNLLCIQAGTGLIELERHRDALLVLQKAWPQQRILSRQEKRLDELKEQFRRAQASETPNQDEQLELEQLVAEVEEDLERVRQIEGYDTALRYRIAHCFYSLERFRESYLVFSLMVKELPVSDLLMQANYQMLVALTRMERWQEAIDAANDFEKNFPENTLVPNVLYLQAEAMMKIYQYQQSAEVFQAIVDRYPKFPEVERCHFLAGYSLMMVERNEEAVVHFEKHLERWATKGQGFHEQAVYWKAMAYYYGKVYPQGREAHAAYLKEYPQGQYVVDSEYRMAHALYGQKLFIEAYKELESFITTHEADLLADEARNLLGDCYFAMGEIDRGLVVYRTTTIRDGRLYDYAQFRIGKALKATEEYEKMREHFEVFLAERAGSSRVTEALSQLAWLHRKEEQPEKARDLYWESIQKYGNDPEAPAVEEMMRTLGKYYRGDKRTEYISKLSELGEAMESQQKVTLATRCLWMVAQLMPKEAEAEKQSVLLRAADMADPKQMSPVVLADVADSLRAGGKLEQAEQFYRTILFWYPRSLLKDRAYAGLGLLFQSQGNIEESLHYYGLFERETVKSPLWAEVLQSRAALYQQKGELSKAVNELERILEIKSARGKPWVEALYQVGEIHLKQQQPKKAIPYFQRIYIMYGRWSDYVAKAYWESGQAFEQLQMQQEAVNTYQEFAANTHLKETPEYQQAVDRLKAMGAPLKAPPVETVEEGV
ncbi:MAG: tetratricopeptide repeat protein [Verrucomicrobiota bacterium]